MLTVTETAATNDRVSRCFALQTAIAGRDAFTSISAQITTARK
jgi:hypothetical protein